MEKINIELNSIENKYYRNILKDIAEEMNLLNNDTIVGTEEQIESLRSQSTMQLHEIQKSYTNLGKTIKSEINKSLMKEMQEQDVEDYVESVSIPADKRLYVKGYSNCKLETRGQSCVEQNILVEDINKKEYTINTKFKSNNELINQKMIDGNTLKITDGSIHSIKDLDFSFEYFLPKTEQILSIDDTKKLINNKDFMLVKPDVFKDGISLDRNSLDLLLLKNSAVENKTNDLNIKENEELR